MRTLVLVLLDIGCMLLVEELVATEDFLHACGQRMAISFWEISWDCSRTSRRAFFIMSLYLMDSYRVQSEANWLSVAVALEKAVIAAGV